MKKLLRAETEQLLEDLVEHRVQKRLAEMDPSYREPVPVDYVEQCRAAAVRASSAD